LASRLVAAGQRDAPPLTAETWPNSGLTHPADPFGLLADDGEHSRVAWCRRDGGKYLAAAHQRLAVSR
jgi:hypothetical protein